MAAILHALFEHRARSRPGRVMRWQPWPQRGCCRWLTTERRVAVVPGRSFYDDPTPARHLVRYAFPEHLETLAQTVERLAGRGVGD